MSETAHLELLLEEPSMEALLIRLLPRLAGERCTFALHVFQGKYDLLTKLEARLKAYARWIPSNYRIIILIDQDEDECHELKKRLECLARKAGLLSRTEAADPHWQLVNRIAVQELEAWYFGDWESVRTAFPRVRTVVHRKDGFRDPDSIKRTWEAFERVLKSHGYFRTGLRKIEAAKTLGALLDYERSRSRSFKHFCSAIMEAAL